MRVINRRTFLGTSIAGMVVSAGSGLPGISARARSADVSPELLNRAEVILSANPSIDLHNHLGYWEQKGLTAIMKAAAYRGDDSTRGVAQAMIAAKCKSAWICLTGDVPVIELGKPGNKARDYAGDEAWQEYQRQMGLLQEFFGTMPIVVAHQPDDIDRIAGEGKLAVFLSTEGGHMVEKDLSRLEQLRKDGLTKFQPVHYVHTTLGDNQTDPSSYGGMSPTGIEAVKEAARLGVILQ